MQILSSVATSNLSLLDCLQRCMRGSRGWGLSGGKNRPVTRKGSTVFDFSTYLSVPSLSRLCKAEPGPASAPRDHLSTGDVQVPCTGVHADLKLRSHFKSVSS